MSRLREGEYVKNPKTNRLIKVGGRTYKNLVRDNIIEPRFQDEEHVYEYQPQESAAEAKRRIQKELPLGRQAVRGRGIYKNNIVTRHTPLFRKIIKKLEDGELSEESASMVEAHLNQGTINKFLDSISPKTETKQVISKSEKEIEEIEEEESSDEEKESSDGEEEEEKDDEDDEYFGGEMFSFRFEK